MSSFNLPPFYFEERIKFNLILFESHYKKFPLFHSILLKKLLELKNEVTAKGINKFKTQIKCQVVKFIFMDIYNHQRNYYIRFLIGCQVFEKTIYN